MPTIVDVARVAGVSKSTVSRAFTAPHAVSFHTLKRITRAAKSVNYTPNAIARAMITKKTGNIGFIIYNLQAPAIVNPFYGPILESVVEIMAREGYGIFISSDSGLKNNPGELMLSKQVDGVILASRTNAAIVSSFTGRGIPVVLLNYRFNRAGVYSVLSDDAGGIMNAVRYLFDAGHRHIGFIEGRFTRFIFRRRRQGFIDAMKASGLSIKPEFCAVVAPAIEDAFDSVYAMLGREKRPSVLLCTNDVVAVGAVKAALRRGLRVPEDISVVGYDNSELCTACQPALTSIDTNTRELGRKAVEYLLKQIEGKKPESTTATVETRLVERESVAIKQAAHAALIRDYH
ncbi:MAG: LacI family transcriptional regulator [Spirochaetaceae bacterium]|nr:LacI family transcriptional regulator [Spirochaetaceae bacterium]